MRDFFVCFFSRLKWPAREVQVYKNDNGNWVSVGMIEEYRTNPKCFKVTSNSSNLTLKIAPDGGRKDNQLCKLLDCGTCNTCDGPTPIPPPPPPLPSEGWTLDIEFSCEKEKPVTDPGTTTVEIRDNQPPQP